MRGEIWVTVFVLVLSLGFGIFLIQENFLTGYVTHDVAGDGDVIEATFTREDALQALNESQDIIDEMKRANFTGVFAEDMLTEAEKVFQQVDYAEILRGNVNASNEEKTGARNALEFVDWRYLNYSDVLGYTEQIVEIREVAFYIQDLLSLQETFLGTVRDESGEIVSFTKVKEIHLERFKFLINEVQLAIEEERYDEAVVLGEELKEEVSLRRTEVFTALTLAQGFGKLIVKYWYFTLLVLIILILLGYYSFKIISRGLLKRKIRRSKIEEKVLVALMKKTQEERFKDNEISELVYDIRMKKFEEKLNLIKENLPVLEARLVGKKVVRSKNVEKPAKKGQLVISKEKEEEKVEEEIKKGRKKFWGRKKKKEKKSKKKNEKKEDVSTIARRLVSRWQGK